MMIKHKRVLVINKQWVLQEQNENGEWDVIKIQPALNLSPGFYDLNEFSFPKKNKKYIGGVLYKDEKYVFFRAEQSRAEQSRAEQSRAEQSRAEQSRAEQSRAEQSTFRIKTVLFKGAVPSIGDKLCLEF